MTLPILEKCLILLLLFLLLLFLLLLLLLYDAVRGSCYGFNQPKKEKAFLSPLFKRIFSS